jgi:hypothetical protein
VEKKKRDFFFLNGNKTVFYYFKTEEKKNNFNSFIYLCIPNFEKLGNTRPIITDNSVDSSGDLLNLARLQVLDFRSHVLDAVALKIHGAITGKQNLATAEVDLLKVNVLFARGVQEPNLEQLWHAGRRIADSRVNPARDLKIVAASRHLDLTELLSDVVWRDLVSWSVGCEQNRTTLEIDGLEVTTFESRRHFFLLRMIFFLSEREH